MRFILVAALSVLIASLFSGWILLARKRLQPWHGWAVVAAFMTWPLAYFAGVLVTSFDDNLCYSSVIADLRDIQSSAPASTPHKPLPLHGYETRCSELSAAVRAWKEGTVPR